MAATWNRCKSCKRRSERATRGADGLCVPCYGASTTILFTRPVRFDIPPGVDITGDLAKYRFDYRIRP